MREPTDEERSLLAERRARFAPYFAESMPVLVDLCTALGLPEPWRVVNEPNRMLPAVDTWLQTQARPGTVAPEDRAWLASRLGYLIGYVLTERHGGAWMVDDDPDSRTFARFVVGDLRPTGARVDPNRAAADYVDGLAGVSLGELVDGISAAVAQAGPRARS